MAKLPQNADFPPTRWSMVQAVQQGTAEESARAMEDLCRSYWYPIYAYLRRSGRSEHDAEDLTQEFFQRLMAENAIEAARKGDGKLRSWLLGVLKHLLSDEGRHRNTQKRGGEVEHVPFELMGRKNAIYTSPSTIRIRSGFSLTRGRRNSSPLCGKNCGPPMLPGERATPSTCCCPFS